MSSVATPEGSAVLVPVRGVRQKQERHRSRGGSGIAHLVQRAATVTRLFRAGGENPAIGEMLMLQGASAQPGDFLTIPGARGRLDWANSRQPRSGCASEKEWSSVSLNQASHRFN